MGISQTLPPTGYLRMFDIWMVFTMSYPFFVIAFHSLLEVKLLCIRYSLSRFVQIQILQKKKQNNQIRDGSSSTLFSKFIICKLIILILVFPKGNKSINGSMKTTFDLHR